MYVGEVSSKWLFIIYFIIIWKMKQFSDQGVTQASRALYNEMLVPVRGVDLSQCNEY